MDSSSYYFNTLDRPGKACYHAMLEGLLSLQNSFPIPLLEGRRMADIFFLLRLDHPEIFWCGDFRYRFMNGAENGEMIPEYLFAKNKIHDQQTAMEARVRKLVLRAQTMKEEEKILYIHDLICSSVRYDKLKKAYSHEIIGPLGQGVGVCEGIAKAVKILCDRLGIWCIIAVSEADPEKKIRYRHAWNILRCGGQTYHLDATFDNSLSSDEQIRHDYYLLPDEKIFRDHEPVIWKVPTCTDGKRFYYLEKKLSFTKIEDVHRRAAQAAKKGKVLLFHWRGGYLTREVLAELLRALQEEAQARGKYAQVSLNWPQAVICTSFAESVPAEEVVWEEANEGEKYAESSDVVK